MPTSPAELAYVTVERDYAIGVLANDVLVTWLGATTVPAIHRVRGVVARVAEEHGGKVGLLQYVSESAPLPGEPALRVALVDFLRECDPLLACLVLAAPGTGFRISAGRAIVTGLMMLARPRFPQTVCSTLDAAAEWQAPLLPSTDSPIASAQIAACTRQLIAAAGSTTDE